MFAFETAQCDPAVAWSGDLFLICIIIIIVVLNITTTTINKFRRFLFLSFPTVPCFNAPSFSLSLSLDRLTIQSIHWLSLYSTFVRSNAKTQLGQQRRRHRTRKERTVELQQTPNSTVVTAPHRSIHSFDHSVIYLSINHSIGPRELSVLE